MMANFIRVEHLHFRAYHIVCSFGAFFIVAQVLVQPEGFRFVVKSEKPMIESLVNVKAFFHRTHQF